MIRRCVGSLGRNLQINVSSFDGRGFSRSGAQPAARAGQEGRPKSNRVDRAMATLGRAKPADVKADEAGELMAGPPKLPDRWRAALIEHGRRQHK